MWTVLLDRSGSMRGGGHGPTGFRGRTSTTTAEQKLEAAKQVLRERLAGIARTTVAIFAFDRGTELVYDGPSDEAARIDSALAGIEPGSGTDVAAALDAARDHAVRTRATFPLVVLVVSDGLDDPERARTSAEELARHGAIINVPLVDPTPDGERLARAIYVNGRVQAVTTAAELRRSAAASAEREADLAREAERWLDTREEPPDDSPDDWDEDTDDWDEDTVPRQQRRAPVALLMGAAGRAVRDGDAHRLPSRSPTRYGYGSPGIPLLGMDPPGGIASVELVCDERIGFTVGAAAVISPGHWESLFVCLHLAELSNEVAEMLRKRLLRLQAHPTISNGYGPPTLSKGAVLRLTPRAGDLEFNPAMQEVVWNEDIQTHEFRYRARLPAAGKPVAGVVEIHVLLKDAPRTLVGLLGFSVQVRGPGVPVEQSDSEVRAHASMTFDSVFASHASKDKALVQACVASYQALGIRVHIDSESLRASSGDFWWPLLQGLIRRSDLFMLYWSKHAKASEVVRVEWQYALDVATSKGDRFVRPVVWETDHPAPPAELAHLHFARLDVGALPSRLQVRLAAAVLVMLLLFLFAVFALFH